MRPKFIKSIIFLTFGKYFPVGWPWKKKKRTLVMSPPPSFTRSRQTCRLMCTAHTQCFPGSNNQKGLSLFLFFCICQGQGQLFALHSRISRGKIMFPFPEIVFVHRPLNHYQPRKETFFQRSFIHIQSNTRS